MKRLLTSMAFAICLSVLAIPDIAAQHSKKSLLHPDYDDFNLKYWPYTITVVQRYQSGNDINFQETYTFDSAGYLSEYRKQGFGGEQVTHYPLATLPANRLYSFDNVDDIIEIRQFDLKGRLQNSTHFIFDEKDLLVQTVEYTYNVDSGVVAKRTVTEFDKHERIASIAQYTVDELLLWTEKRKYDRHGNLTKRVQTFYDDEGKNVSTEKRDYTYDSHGNWTICRLFSGDKAICTIERSIKYF